MSKQSSFFLQNLNLIDVDKGRVLCNASLRIEEGKIVLILKKKRSSGKPSAKKTH